jgi:predicted dehydrogenase
MITSFAILGSGFGLYGYLPALVQQGVQRILLPERYRNRFVGRLELSPFAGNIQWEEDEQSVLDHADGVVLALRPVDQHRWIPRCLERSNLRSMILEKPLAHSPELAAALLEDLLHSDKVFRMGYTFRYTNWGRQLLDTLMQKSKKQDLDLLSIRWSFLAHHYRHDLDNWKRFNATGGGAIRFYGIQIIALLAEIGYTHVTSSLAFGPSADETEKWSAVFEGQDLPACKVVLDTKSTVDKFEIERVFHTKGGTKTITVANKSDPFDVENGFHIVDKMDRRVPLLGRLYDTLSEKSENYYKCYGATIRLWRRIEEKTRSQETKVVLT